MRLWNRWAEKPPTDVDYDASARVQTVSHDGTIAPHIRGITAPPPDPTYWCRTFDLRRAVEEDATTMPMLPGPIHVVNNAGDSQAAQLLEERTRQLSEWRDEHDRLLGELRHSMRSHDRLQADNAVLRADLQDLQARIGRALAMLPIIQGQAQQLGEDGLQSTIARELKLAHAAIHEALTLDPTMIERTQRHDPKSAEYTPPSSALLAAEGPTQ